MNLNDFLGFFDFTYKKYKNGYGFVDLQGANLGDIESERYNSPQDMVDRLGGSIYIPDYIDNDLKEYGCMETTWEAQYDWCVKHNHSFATIIYVFLHPETIVE